MHLLAADDALVVGSCELGVCRVRVQGVHVADGAPRQHYVVVRTLEAPVCHQCHQHLGFMWL